jgi:O-methyltransferase
MTDILRSINKRLSKYCGFTINKYREFPSDFECDHIDIIRSVQPFTMTGPEKLYSLIQAVKYIIQNNVPGDIVECGVWRGGSMMAVAQTLLRLNHTKKSLFLYDTFSGMSKPTELDVNFHGLKAFDKFQKKRLPGGKTNWCIASLNEVKESLLQVGYDQSKINFIKGEVEETIPEKAPENISLLRLDTDWYASTKHELIHLFPRLAKNGVLIIDDYGHWEGCKKAVDEYFSENKINIYLTRVDYSARMGIKL